MKKAERIIFEGRKAVADLLKVDAVHHLPHAPMDVKTIDCDFLVFLGINFSLPMEASFMEKRRKYEFLSERVTPFLIKLEAC